ncbi:hypothetical protein Tco_0480570 [Tanacetum coccineum]
MLPSILSLHSSQSLDLHSWPLDRFDEHTDCQHGIRPFLISNGYVFSHISSSLNKSSTTISDLYKGLNIITELLKEINNAVKDDLVIIKKINEATKSFTKISTNIAEVLSLVKGFNFVDLQSSVNALQAHALKQDEELAAWAKSSTNMAWNLSSRLLGIVTLTLALTHILANDEGENDTNIATEDPPSHIEGKTDSNRQEKSEEPKQSTDANIEFIGKGIATDEKVEDQRKLVKASFIIRLDPDALIPYTTNGEVHYLTAKQLQAYMDKEEKIKKVEKEAKLFAISKPEVIKLKMLSMRSSRDNILRKSENLLNSGSPNLIITFGISELDELREIIPKKKNAVVQDLMNSLSQRYERIRKIPEELGIKSPLPVPPPAPEQTLSKSSRKRKHMELEPKIKIPRLECNRALRKNVMFVNNMVIEEPKHVIFFTDEFGD